MTMTELRDMHQILEEMIRNIKQEFPFDDGLIISAYEHMKFQILKKMINHVTGGAQQTCKQP